MTKDWKVHWEWDIKLWIMVYDLLSGKVNQVVYQEGEVDQFIHEYQYDEQNKLIEVRSGERPELLETDAHYFYYLHGPLARDRNR